MSDSTDTAQELLPCPFCGGEAERFTLEDDENLGGDVICCTDCQASSNVEFGFKENLVANWNRRTELPLECFVSRPDNTVGMAYLDRRGFPFPDTVCSTERGAMVNYLVTVCRITPTADWSDAKIKEQFEMHKMGGSVGCVSIERLFVSEEESDG
jgi:Lar family restriction alleviation protein